MPAGEAPANKTKTKKLIIFGFFLINIQTGPAGSSALEGERRRRKKPQTKSNRHILWCLPFLCLSLLYLSLIRGSKFHINSQILQMQECGQKPSLSLSLSKVLGWENGSVKQKEAGGKKRVRRYKTEAKERMRERWKERQSKCDSGN